MSPTSQTFVIAGAGLAGATAAQTLREEGFEGRVVLVGDEPDRPYERPPLSKEFLRGETEEPPFVHPEGFYDSHAIELMRSTRIARIVPEAHELELPGGEYLAYDKLLICTGARPRKLDVAGSDLPNIHYLRDLADSRTIGERLGRGGRIVVVGSGWIGAEIAASARQKGCQVTMIEMASLPLQKVLGDEVASLYLDIHRSHGVEFLPETTVDRFVGDAAVERVYTRDGAEIETDFVVVGVGVTPRTELAESAGLAIENGVLVDESLHAGNDIYAAGDVANALHPFYGRRLRVEHWANARAQGAAAARSMLGRPVSYEEVPYFFSDQYDVGMEYRGHADGWDEVVLRGDPASGEFVAFWLAEGRLLAGMNVNVWDVSETVGELISSRRQLDPELLRDPDVPLAELAKSGEPAK
jgi:3-phenylpropionate/trans-cinnamate dioxygenase ferredoxin reductase subunit